MNETEKHYLIVGLGNPGKEYALTRHNVGYLIVQAFAVQQGWLFKEERQFTAHVAKGKIAEKTIHLLLPLTYMNESGRAVRRYLDFYHLGPEQLVVISDDVELPFGTMRLRPGGSAGGHNGLKSIQSHLHTMQYARLRVGIGRTLQQERTLADYVLDTFAPEERLKLPKLMEEGAAILRRLPQEEIAKVMNEVNSPKGGPGEQ